MTHIEQPDLKKILPQNFPFLMIDSVTEFHKGQSLTAIKNITAGEWCFDGGRFPETLLMEASAQTALAFHYLNQTDPNFSGAKVFLAGTKAEFLGDVFVGDQLRMELKSFRQMSNKGFADIESFVGEDKKAEVKIFYGVVKQS